MPVYTLHVATTIVQLTRKSTLLKHIRLSSFIVEFAKHVKNFRVEHLSAQGIRYKSPCDEAMTSHWYNLAILKCSEARWWSSSRSNHHTVSPYMNSSIEAITCLCMWQLHVERAMQGHKDSTIQVISHQFFMALHQCFSCWRNFARR
jgi:hypothetical protein